MCIPFDIVEHEYRARAGCQAGGRGLDRREHERAFVLWGRRGR